MTPKKYQVYVGGYVMLWQVGMSHIVVTLYFYFGGKYWKMAYGPWLVATVISLFICFLVPESPRYLYSKKDWPRLYQNLNTIASFNGVDMFRQAKNFNTNTHSKQLLSSEEDETAESDFKTQEYSVLAALRNRKTFVNLVAVIIWFSVVSFNFYIIGFYLKYIGGNIYINTLVCTLSEFLGTTSFWLIQNLFGTKKGFVLWFVWTAIFSAPLMFITNPAQIATSVLLAKYFIEVTFCLAYFVGPEYFDPLFVPFSFSMCSFWARFITMAAPQIAEIKPRQIPIIVFLIISGVASISAMLLTKPDKKDSPKTES